jgi:sortase A
MRLLAVFGKLLISLGMGVLLFVAWTLWGTGLYTERQQARLEEVFAAQPPFENAIPPAGKPSRPSGPPPSFRPGPGEPAFRLSIPAIRLSQVVVEGVGVEELKLGPGHYPSCGKAFLPPFCSRLDEVWPGEKGRVIVSGHRTTYSAPFWALNELGTGDEVITETRWGDFLYKVSGKETVEPGSRDIANPAATKAREIVLTTCNPRFSATERLIVFARLERVQAEARRSTRRSRAVSVAGGPRRSESKVSLGDRRERT